MDLKEDLKKRIAGVLEVPEKDIILTSETVHGDLSTNAVLANFHKFKDKFKNPIDLGIHVVSELQKNLPKPVKKAEILPPGFLNFFFHENFLFEQLEKIKSEKENYGKGENLKGKKIVLEYADPNPFKEFHIGHLRNISLGESYARLLELQGGDVIRANYQGDVGLHVAKAIYGLLTINTPQLTINKQKPLKEKIKMLADAYASGSKAYEEDKEAKKKIEEINLKVYQKTDEAINNLWESGRELSLKHFEDIYKRVGTKYDKYYFESEVADIGKKLVLSNLDGIFERHDGAVVFRGSHTRVFVTKEDYSTYEAKDFGLAKQKYEDFGFDRSIVITANEQIEYFRVVLEAMGKVLPEIAKKTSHESFGFVNLKDGKMSSRSGNIVAGEWLLEEAKKRLKEKFSSKGEPREEMDAETLEKVAVGAVKYSMLKFSRKSDISFSFDESISLEGNSGPYIQYTYARTQSVLAKSQITNFKSQINSNIQNSKWEKEEELVLRLLVKFPDVAGEAQENFAPNLLANYLFELSQAFNNFYQKHKIIGGKEEDFRLSLTSGVGQILKNGLNLLGIDAPRKM